MDVKSEAHFVFDSFGGADVVASELRMSVSGVRNWPERGIPFKRRLELAPIARERGLNEVADRLLAINSPSMETNTG